MLFGLQAKRLSALSPSHDVHPLGEEPFNFEFHPSGGKFHLRGTDDALTAYGGLVAWDHFLSKTGILNKLAEDYPLPRTSPNATPVEDILNAFALNSLVGGKRFAHMRRLQDDRAIAKILGLLKGRLCGEDAFRRLCAPLEVNQARQWMEGAERAIYQALPNHCISDWDSTVCTRYGSQEDVAVGYNPQKPGRPSHHPLVCAIAGTRMALHMEWRKGNTVSATGWIEAMEKVWRNPIAQHRIQLNRGDIGFGQEKIMAWHEEEGAHRPRYLFKLKLTQNVKRAIQAVDWPEWQGHPTEGMQQLVELKLKLTGWSQTRRVVVSRTLKPLNPGPQEDFWRLGDEIIHAYVTNLDEEQAEAFQVVELYRQRGDAENVFDELKNQWGFAGFCAQNAVVSECAARLLLLIYNLWSIFVRVIKNQQGHTEAITSRYELLMIPGRLVTSGRQKTLRLAVGNKLGKLLKAAYKRLIDWLSQTAPQLALDSGKSPPWLLFNPLAHPG